MKAGFLLVGLLLTGCASLYPGGRADSLVLDHIFLWVQKDAPEAESLRKMGLRGYGPFKHAGQGTSSLGFHFENAYLELIWIDDPVLAERAGTAIRVNFAQRSRGVEGASPFGIGFHLHPDNSPVPFPTVVHKATWMQPDEEILVARTASNSLEPYIFIVPASMANPMPEALPALYEKYPRLREIRKHALGIRRITEAHFLIDATALDSPTVGLIEQSNVLSFAAGDRPLARLTFDDNIQGKEADLRPELPLLIAY